MILSQINTQLTNNDEATHNHLPVMVKHITYGSQHNVKAYAYSFKAIGKYYDALSALTAIVNRHLWSFRIPAYKPFPPSTLHISLICSRLKALAEVRSVSEAVVTNLQQYSLFHHIQIFSLPFMFPHVLWSHNQLDTFHHDLVQTNKLYSPP